MAKQGLGIRLREYKQGRISITADIALLNSMKRWAISHAAENNDQVAKEFIIVHDKYLRIEKDTMAKMIYKDIKSHKRTRPLTQREKDILKDTKFEGYFRKIGWL